MRAPDGYELHELLHEADEVVVYRATRKADDKAVVVKTLRGEHPSLVGLARLRHEYALLQGLSLPGVIEVVDLVRHGAGLAMIVEDIGGVSLRRLLDERGNLGLRSFLRIAAGAAAALGGLHRADIVHKDVTPGNVIFNEETGELRVIDLGIASRLPREAPELYTRGRLQGTLAYISPEQTGRMNRAVDYRTDLYSLGATLYHLLTGRVPFAGTDWLGIIHGHIARRARPPAELDPTVPKVLSELVMRLLAKDPDDRYQSAVALQSDLEACLSALDEGGDLDAVQLTGHRVSDRFRVPDRLYHRDAERNALLGAFERVVGGGTGVATVTGPPGIGKSALVNEIQKPVVRTRGAFVRGKFDQLARTGPYSGLTEALSELVSQVLAADPEVVEATRERLVEAVGPNGRLVTDVIPQVKLLIGEQPAVDELTPTEARNRFHLVFSAFVGALASAERPLVLFLDDLQWADSASLELLQALLGGGVEHVLAVLAWRDGEIDADHPVNSLLSGLEQAGLDIPRIELGPLDEVDVLALVSDTVGTPEDDARPLATFLHTRTGGNPFFLVQLLERFHRDGLFRFDPEAHRWTWDAAALAQQTVPDNVVDLVISRLDALPADTRKALQVGAVLGARFSLVDLAATTSTPPAALTQELWPAVARGLLVPEGETWAYLQDGAVDGDDDARAAAVEQVHYRFAHDNVQAAARSTLAEDEAATLHLAVGRRLRTALAEGRAELLFDVVDHLDRVLDQLDTQEERRDVAQLNLDASTRARDATAFDAAARYARAGRSLLDEAAWTEAPGLAFTVNLEAARTAYLTGAFDEANGLFAVLEERSPGAVASAGVLLLRMTLHLNTGELLKVIDLGNEGLSLFDAAVPTQPDQDAIGAAFGAVVAALEGRDLDKLADAEPMTDPVAQSTAGLLFFMAMGAYLSGQNDLWQLVVLRMVKLHLDHGTSPFAAYAYAAMGMLVGPGVGDFASASKWGQAAIAVADTFGLRASRCVSRFLVGCFIDHWVTPLDAALPNLRSAFQLGLDSGNLIYCAFSHSSEAINRVFGGAPLDEVSELNDRAEAFAARIQYADMVCYYLVYRGWMAALRGDSDGPTSLSTDALPESALMERLEAQVFPVPRHAATVLKAWLHLMLGDVDTAWTWLQTGEPLLPGSFGLYLSAEDRFLRALVGAMRLPALPEAERVAAREAVDADLAQLDAWAAHQPDTYGSGAHLVRAELAIQAGEDAAAIRHYAAAADGSAAAGILHRPAFAGERAARYHLAAGREREGRTWLREAHYAWLRWGATEPARRLALAHGLDPSPQSWDTRGTLDRTTGLSTDSSVDALDLQSVLRASQAISATLELDRLAEAVLGLALTNAGAQRSALLFADSDDRITLAALGWTSERRATEGFELRSERIDETGDLPRSIVRYVARTKEPLILADARRDGRFHSDPYVRQHRTQSVLCLPLLNQGNLRAIIYLENGSIADAFTEEHVAIVDVLTGPWPSPSRTPACTPAWSRRSASAPASCPTPSTSCARPRASWWRRRRWPRWAAWSPESRTRSTRRSASA